MTTLERRLVSKEHYKLDMPDPSTKLSMSLRLSVVRVLCERETILNPKSKAGVGPDNIETRFLLAV